MNENLTFSKQLTDTCQLVQVEIERFQTSSEDRVRELRSQVTRLENEREQLKEQREEANSQQVCQCGGGKSVQFGVAEDSWSKIREKTPPVCLFSVLVPIPDDMFQIRELKRAAEKAEKERLKYERDLHDTNGELRNIEKLLAGKYQVTYHPI